MRNHTRRLCLCWLVVILGMTNALRVPQHAAACASVSTRENPVRIADEEAVIIWDSAHNVEHFIRKATFKTNAKDFGFLVPTPTIPDLAEAKDEVFGDFDLLTTIHHWHLSLGCGASSDTSSASQTEPAVEVLKSQRVGGLDAVVLQAKDAGALTGWLRSHGYSARPALNDWLTPYVAAGWKITAFKISTDRAPGEGVVSTVVRMSFPCTEPYFPYREPVDQREPSNPKEGPSAGTLPVHRDSSSGQNGSTQTGERLLRIYFLSGGPMEGSMGDSNEWPGVTTFSRPVVDEWRPILAGKLSLRPEQLPAKQWLTVFEDSSSPRPGTDDVYFRPASPEHSQPFPETDDERGHALFIDANGILLTLGLIVLYLRIRRHRGRPNGNDLGRTQVLGGRQP